MVREVLVAVVAKEELLILLLRTLTGVQVVVVALGELLYPGVILR